MAHVLIVDDEVDLAQLLDFNLRQQGYTTSVAHSGEAALAEARQRVPDLVLLDLMLPDVAGTEVCRQLKQNPRTAGARIIMLTAKGEEVDRVVGFQLGADDYVTKPFSVRELVLRVGAVLRRAQEPKQEESRNKVGMVEIDPASHRAFVDGDEVELTALEFRLLAHFMSRLGRVQTREELLAVVWKVSSESQTRTVDTHVKRLRERLGKARDLVETVRGVGYRMVDPRER